MKKTSFLGAVMSGALAAAPAMADDSFHALSRMSSDVTAMSEAQLASIEGGQSTTGCVSSASAAGALLPINLGNCNNIAVVVPVNLCLNVIVGACAGAQSNSVFLDQSLASIFNPPKK